MAYSGSLILLNEALQNNTNTLFQASVPFLLLLIPFPNYVFISCVRAVRFMDTHSKTNVEFRNEVNEALACHDTNFEELNHNFGRVSTALQRAMAEPQAMRIAQSNHTSDKEVNPFAAG